MSGPSPDPSNDNRDLRAVLSVPMRSVKRTLAASAVTLFAFAVLIPISSAVIANGNVSPIGQTRTVEAPSGGRLVSVAYSEGDLVERGAVLATVADAQAKATFATSQTQLIQALAEETRLRAERLELAQLDLSAIASRPWPGADVEAILAAEQSRFVSSTSAHETRLAVLKQRIAQREDQIDGFARQMISLEEQARITREELAVVEPLLARGLVRTTRVLDLQRGQSVLSGQMGLLRARIAEAREAIGETRYQLAGAAEERLRELDASLADVQTRRLQLEEDYVVRQEALDRSQIRAPVTGRLSNVRTFTEGEVIAAGDAIVDLVPTEEALVIEASIRPQDIDDVQLGQAATIMLTALPLRSAPRLDGSVRSVSPDLYRDPATGETSYRVLVEIAEDQTQEAEALLVPGMPADVFFKTADRTLLGYLFDPIVFAVSRTFRES